MTIAVFVSSTRNDGSCVGSTKMSDDSRGVPNEGSRCSCVSAARGMTVVFLSNRRIDHTAVFHMKRCLLVLCSTTCGKIVQVFFSHES